MTTRELLRHCAKYIDDSCGGENQESAALRAIADRFDAEMEMAWKRSQRSVLARLDALSLHPGQPEGSGER